MKLSEYFGVNFEHADEEDLQQKIKALIIAENLDGGELDTLDKAYQCGAMESGDTPSKSGRASLLKKGVLCQTCCLESNYTFSVTYPLGLDVVKALEVLKH